jgi:hypothetical protein
MYGAARDQWKACFGRENLEPASSRSNTLTILCIHLATALESRTSCNASVLQDRLVGSRPFAIL